MREAQSGRMKTDDSDAAERTGIGQGGMAETMERVNRILNHDLFKKYLKKNKSAEENRQFCHHDMGHFLDVARLAMIFYLKERCAQTAVDRTKTDVQTAGGGAENGAQGCDGKKGSFGAKLYGSEPQISEELIYAAALLHDIGRWKQYEDGTPHEKASAELAPEILADCGFRAEETEQILTAILNHRNEKIKEEQSLSGILYRADKMSRSCFACEAEAACDWKGTKKNLELRY